MKRKNQLFILILVLALLGGGYAFLSSREPEEETPVIVDDAYEILSVPTGDVEEMSWVCGGRTDEFRFHNLGEIWEYVPDKEKQLDNDYLNTLAGIFSTFNAYRELEMPEDLSVYGLDEPYLTVTLKTIGGEEYTIVFGDATSVAGRRYCVIGDGKVYTVSSSAASAFNYDLGDVVDLGE